jgi:ribosomal protein S12 methylthiotransferase accessory factor
MCYRLAVIRYPRLRDHISAEVIRPDLAVIFSDVEHWPFEGPLYPRLLPILDGSRSVATIIKELSGCNVAEIQAALLILERSGYVTDASESNRSQNTPDSLGDETDTPMIRHILQTFGFEIDSSGELTVVIADEYLRHELAEFADAAARVNRGWLPVKPSGTVVWLGPIVQPPLTPCWNCLRERLRANRPAHAWLESRGKLPPRPLELSAKSTLQVTFLGQSNTQPADGTLLTIDAGTWQYSKHRVVRQPGCAWCWTSNESRTRTRSSVASLFKRQRSIRAVDGGWRTASSDWTFSKHKHHISQITGVISRLQRRSFEALPLELYTAEHLFAPAEGDPFGSGRRVSAGKGMSRKQARTSALCEALERYSGVFRGDEPRIRASCQALGAAAIRPNVCTNFSEAQFDRRDIWNAGAASEAWIPPRLDDDQEIEWTPVRSLTDGTIRYAPVAYCYYGYRAAPAEACCRADSNGCAAGNNLEEAALQGFLELVERDAVAIWWYNELVRPSVDLATFGHPYCHEMLEDYDRAGRSLVVFDLTTDLGIPVFAAVSESETPARQGPLLGFGAHLDAQTALARALTELNQWRAGVALGGVAAWLSDADGRPGDFLREKLSTRMRRKADFVAPRFRDIRDALRICVEKASRLGLETFILDQTREDVGLAVVRVIVPGLRHFWPRFGPGRLYTVPVEMGWTVTCRAEEQLNNFHLLI